MATVSVVIPVYNIEAHLRQCLDSVEAQTLSDLEIICVDDGSTDTSLQILQKYAEQDSRFRIVTQTNAGPGMARNAGLKAATGKFLIFLDSDDWFEPEFLELMVKQAEKSGADVTICRAIEFDTDTKTEFPAEWMLKTQYLPGEIFSPVDVKAYLFQFTYGMAWDKLYVRSFLTQKNLTFPSLLNSEDLAFVFPSLLAANCIAVLDRVLLHHRVNRAESVSNTRCSQPEAPYQAFNIVKDYLETTGQMGQYEQSFLNWAMEFLVWHVCNMDDPIIQRQYLSVLRKIWFPAVSFDRFPRSYYRDRLVYAKYIAAKKLPGWLFFGIVKLYKAEKTRACFSSCRRLFCTEKHG